MTAMAEVVDVMLLYVLCRSLECKDCPEAQYEAIDATVTCSSASQKTGAANSSSITCLQQCSCQPWCRA